jgi:hypothetical protein
MYHIYCFAMQKKLEEAACMKINCLAGGNFNPKDWHVDVSTDYVTYFPADLGFSVGFLPRDFASDGLSTDDFVAEPVHFPAWGEVPGHDELVRLSHIAAVLFGTRFIAKLNARRYSPEADDTDEAA